MEADLSDRQIRKLIRHSSGKQPYLEPTGGELCLIAAAFVIALPLLFLVLAIAVWHFFLPPQ